VLAKYDGDGLAAEDVQTAADCERLNDLELHRLLKLPAGSGGRGRAKPILVVIAAIVVLVSGGITGYLVINGHRHPASPSAPASLSATGTPSAPASPSGPRPTALSFTGLKNPEGVAVDTAGDVYVTDYVNNRVVKWAARSNTQTVLPLIGLSKPLDVAVDTAGNLYVTFNGNNRVLKLPTQ
jgi:serine/threonine protein kinase, bacterial